MVVVDTDVLAIELLFHRDQRYGANHRFLEGIRARGGAITLYNLMELLGIASTHLRRALLTKWEEWLTVAYNLSVLWPLADEPDCNIAIRRLLYDQPIVRIIDKVPYMDALIYNLAEQTPGINGIVTWNVKHFRGKGRLQVWQPDEYLRDKAGV